MQIGNRLLIRALLVLSFTASTLWAQSKSYTNGEDNASTVDTTGDITLTVDSGTATQSGVISGSGLLSKTGVGTLTLSGVNDYSGGTNISAGTVAVTSDSNLGNSSGSIAIMNGATLSAPGNFFTNRAITVDGSGSTLYNNGELIIGYTATSSLTLTNTAYASTYNLSVGWDPTGNGTISVASGSTFTVGNETTLGRFGDAVGDVTITGTDSLFTSGGAYYLGYLGDGTTTIESGGILRAPSLSIATLSGSSGILNLNTGGTLETAGLSTGAGSSNINFAGGTLKSTGTLTSSVDIILGDSTTSTINTNGFATSLSGILSGNGGLTKSGTGTLTLSGANTYSGGTSISAGTLAGSTSSLQGDINNNGAVVFDQDSDDNYDGVLSGSGSLTKSGTGILTLSGANTFSGDTTIDAGTLRLDHENALQNSTLTTTGVVDFGSLTQATFGGISGSQALVLENGSSEALALTVGANDGNTEHSGVISGAGSLIKTGSGTTTLAAANTHTGTTIVNEGVLRLTNSYALQHSTLDIQGGSASYEALNSATLGGLAGSGNLSMQTISYYTELIIGTNNADTSYSGTLSGPGSIIKTGSGNLTLSGSIGKFLDYGYFENPTLSLNAGTLTLANSNALANANVNLNGGSIDFGSLTSATLGRLNTPSYTSQNLILNNSEAIPDPVNLSIGGGSYDGSISGSGNLIITGYFDMEDGSLDHTGDTTVESGGSLRMSRNYTKFIHGTLNLNGSFSAPRDLYLGGLAGSGYIDSVPGAEIVIGLNNKDTNFSGQIFYTYINKSGTGNFTLSGNGEISYSDVYIYEGTTTLNNSQGLADSFVHIDGSGALRFGQIEATTIGQLSGSNPLDLTNQASTPAPVALTIDGLLDYVSYDYDSTTYSGVISGSGSINKIDSKDFILSAANTYTGDTTLSAGTLILANTNAVQASTVNLNGGALNFSGITAAQFGGLKGSGNLALSNTASAALALTFGGNDTNTELTGVISGAGSLTKTGAGTTTLSGSNTYTGTTTIHEGALAIAADSGLGAAPGIANSSQLTLNGGTLIATTTLALDANRGIYLDTTGGTLQANYPGALTVNGVISGSGNLQLDGEGSIILANANTFTGNTTLLDGDLTVRLEHQNALQNSIVAPRFGIQFGLINSANFGGLTGTGELALDNTAETPAAVAITVGNSNDTTYSGVLSGSGSLTKQGSGTLTLSGANSFSGGTIIYAGEIILANNSGSALGSGDVTVASGGTLGGIGSFDGALFVQSGGTFAPGNSPGLVTIGSGSELAGILNIEIGGTLRGTEYDAINVSGDGVITLGGTLNVNLFGDFTPTATDIFDIFDALTIVGNFEAINLPSLNGLNWDISSLYSEGRLGLSMVPEPSAYALSFGLLSLFYSTRRRRK